MIYTKIDDNIQPQVAKIQGDITTYGLTETDLLGTIKVEDSKQREAELKGLLTEVRKSRRAAYGQLDQLRTEEFKNLLAAEYDLPQNHPKFDKVYSYAYQQGHAYGFSEIEMVFADVVELVK